MDDPNDYTDAELLDFLEMTPSATDREVEAKIHQMIRQHPDHAAFYKGIYQRLFDLPPEEDEEEDEQEGFQMDVLRDKKTKKSLTVDELYGQVDPKRHQSIVFTKNLDYAKGGLNPTFNNTIQRVLVIDSRCRDRYTYPSSTDFTLNLTENLRNVLGLNFYYINLPYTWYTISNAFGANFFYLNGAAVGISGLQYAIQFSIQPGNYTTPQSLVDAVNDSIQEVAKVRTDIQFGASKVVLNSTTSGTGKATMSWDVSNRLGDASYEVAFPYWTNDEQSIPGFYGFLQSHPYPLCSVYSNFENAFVRGELDLTTTTTYTLTTTNNVFLIYNKDAAGQILDQIEIRIPLDETFNVYTITDLLFLTTQALQSHPKLNPQYSGLFLETLPTPDGDVQRFRLTVQLQRLTTANTRGQKQFVAFPANSGIWSGKDSAFQFDDMLLALNSTVAEVTGGSGAPDETYETATLEFQCQKYPPDIGSAFNSSHSFLVTVPKTDTLHGHLTAINTGIRQAIPAAQGRLFYYDYYDSGTVKGEIGFQLASGQFQIDARNNILSTVFGLPVVMNAGVTYTSTFAMQSVYTIDNTNRAFVVSNSRDNEPTVTLYLPYAVTKTLPHNGRYYQYRDLSGVEAALNTGKFGFSQATQTFFEYQETDATVTATGPIATKKVPLYGLSLAKTSIQFTKISATMARCTLTWEVFNNVNETDYTVILEGASWAPLGFVETTSFVLRDWTPVGKALAVISASQDVATSSSIQIYDQTLPNDIHQKNNEMWIQPKANADSLDPVADRLVLTVSAGTYTRFSLARALNAQLKQSPITAGSRFTWCGPDLENMRIDWNINKVYTARDYTLTFFDLYEFSSCAASTTSINTTSLTTIRWDQTLGWLIGFRSQNNYTLADATTYADTNAYEVVDQVVRVTGDTPVNINLYNQMHVVLDDFTSNHMNDGIVTVSPPLVDVPAQAYANRARQRCDIVLQHGVPTVVNTDPASTDAPGGRVAPLLSQAQLYAALANDQMRQDKNYRAAKNYSPPPNVRDMFALIPLKLAGLQVGQTYTEFGGTLQQSNRKYFGPVNISRVGIKLVSDRGDIVDLNNNDWSVGIICDISVQPT